MGLSNGSNGQLPGYIYQLYEMEKRSKLEGGVILTLIPLHLPYDSMFLIHFV
jgi:hypothetical protein